MVRSVYNVLGWVLLIFVPPFLFLVFVMLYRELPEYFRTRAAKALRNPAWAARRSATKFWHYSAQLAWFGILFLGALALMSIGEYGFGIFVLVLSSISLSSKTAHWVGFVSHPIWTAALKIVGWIGVVGLFLMFLLIAWDHKGNQPWSHFPQAVVNAVDVWHPIPQIDIFVPPKPEAAPEPTHTSKKAMLEAQQAVTEAQKQKVSSSKFPAPVRSYIALTDKGFLFPAEITASLDKGVQFKVGRWLGFNIPLMVTGPNQVDVIQTYGETYLVSDFSNQTQQATVDEFKKRLSVQEHVGPQTRAAGVTFFFTAFKWDGGQWHNVTQLDLDNLHNGTAIAMIVMQVTYEDSGVVHHLRQCVALQPPAEPPGIWAECSVFNKSD